MKTSLLHNAGQSLHLDADVYLLEDEARQLFEQKIQSISNSGCKELDESLSKAKSIYRAAVNAMSVGDGLAAKNLFSEFLHYPLTRKTLATSIAKEAFKAENWKLGLVAALDADETDLNILFWRGYCSDLGRGCSKNDVEAIGFYQKAADLGHVTAKFNLAVKFEHGQGIVKDIDKAIALYKEVALLGAVDAQKYLGNIYFLGQNVPKDYKESLKWYRMAAECGDVASLSIIGSFYENGYGVEKKLNKAIRWYAKAKNLGDQTAAKRLNDIAALEKMRKAREEKLRLIRESWNREELERKAAAKKYKEKIKSLYKLPKKSSDVQDLNFDESEGERPSESSVGSIVPNAHSGGVRTRCITVAIIALFAILGTGAGVLYWQDARAKEMARISEETKRVAALKRAEDEYRAREEAARRAKEAELRKAHEEAKRVAALKKAEDERRAREEAAHMTPIKIENKGGSSVIHGDDDLDRLLEELASGGDAF